MRDPIKENLSKGSRSALPAAVMGGDVTPESVIARYLPESWFRRQFDESFQFICVLDQEGCVLDANRVALELRGLSLSEVQGRHLWTLPWWDVPGDSRERVRTAIAGARDGTALRLFLELYNSDGTICIFDFRLISVKGIGRGARIIVCEGCDVSEQKRVERALFKARDDLELRVATRTAELAEANDHLRQEAEERQRSEQALRDSEARIHTVLRTAVDAILTIDERGTVTSLNPAAERMFGFRADEIIGRNVKLLMPEPYYSEHDDYLERYMRTGRAKIIGIGREVLGRRKDGQVFPIDLAISEMQLEGQRQFTGIARDITERKRLEREVLEISDEEQMRIGQDLHDGLGQHLTGIAFLAKVIASELAEEESPQAPSAQKIAQLVQDAIARTRDLAHGLSPLGLEAEGLVPALQELARRTDELSGLRCEFHGRDASNPCEGGAAVQLYRIAQESVNNAVKHAKARTVVITLSTEEGRGILSIEDDGTGFALDQPAGSGMGLQVMAYRARMIGGSLVTRRGNSHGTEGGGPRGTIVTCTFILPRTDRARSSSRRSNDKTTKATDRNTKKSRRAPRR